MSTVMNQREAKRQKSNYIADVMVALALLFALVSTHAHAAGQWWWQSYTPNYNGSLTLKDSAGTPVPTTQNPTAGNVKTDQNAATQPPVVVIQTTAGTIYSQTFSSNGTFTVPAGVTKIYVALAGASGGSWNPVGWYGFVSGGAGGIRRNIPITTTAGTNYGIYIGRRGGDNIEGWPPESKGGDGCSGGAYGNTGSNNSWMGGSNGANGSGNTAGQYFGIGSGAGPSNGTAFTNAWQNAARGGIGNAGGTGGINSNISAGGGGGGSTCFHNLVACGGGGGYGAWGSTLYPGLNGACAGLAGDDTAAPGLGDGFVSVTWMQ